MAEHGMHPKKMPKMPKGHPMKEHMPKMPKHKGKM